MNQLKLLGIFPNKVENTILHNSLLKSLKDNKGLASYVAPNFLKKRIIYAEKDADTANPRTIFELPNEHVARQEAIAVTEYIYSKVFEND